MFSKKRAKSALESLMYIWGEPLSVSAAAEACDITKDEALKCFEELAAEYDQEGRGLMIRRVNDSFQFATRPENVDYIEKLCTPVKVRKLSQAALEVLAIIAYKQPVTKSEIDSIRGIKCDRIIEGLVKKELIEDKGRSDAIGRPILYGTTENFLKQFGLTSLKELPEIDDIGNIISHQEGAGLSDDPDTDFEMGENSEGELEGQISIEETIGEAIGDRAETANKENDQ